VYLQEFQNKKNVEAMSCTLTCMCTLHEMSITVSIFRTRRSSNQSSWVITAFRRPQSFRFSTGSTNTQSCANGDIQRLHNIFN